MPPATAGTRVHTPDFLWPDPGASPPGGPAGLTLPAAPGGGVPPEGPPQREGSGPGAPRFSQTPTWRRPPPPATATPPPPQTVPGLREEAPGKFRFPPATPASSRQTTSRGFTYPAGRGQRRWRQRSDSSLSRTPGADSACSPAPAFQGVCCPQSREAGAILTRQAGGWLEQPLAGDSPAPSVEPDNGRPGWLLSCARTAPTRQGASARARAHPPCSLPALSSGFPSPHPYRPARRAQGAGPPAEAPPTEAGVVEHVLRLSCGDARWGAGRCSGARGVALPSFLAR
jgi:hypothetical protein